eukprot:scaffold129607_cov53-Attheya_sp.AAC.3
MEHTESEPIERVVSEVPGKLSLSLTEFFEKERDIEVDTDDYTVNIEATDDDSAVSLFLDKILDQRNEESSKGRQSCRGSLDYFFEKERDSSTTLISTFNDSYSTIAIVCLCDEEKMQEKTSSRVEIESIEQLSDNSISQRQHSRPAEETEEDTLPHMGTDTVSVLEKNENKRASLRQLCTCITHTLDSSQHEPQEVMTRSFKTRRVRFKDDGTDSAERTKMHEEMDQTSEQRNIASLTKHILSLQANIEDLKKVAETHKYRAQHFEDENYHLTSVVEQENSRHNAILCELEKLEVEHVAVTRLCVQLAKKVTSFQVEILEQNNFCKTNHVGKDDLQDKKDTHTARFHPENGDDELDALQDRHIALHRLCSHLTKKNKEMQQIVDESDTKQ